MLKEKINKSTIIDVKYGLMGHQVSMTTLTNVSTNLFEREKNIFCPAITSIQTVEFARISLWSNKRKTRLSATDTPELHGMKHRTTHAHSNV